MLDTQHTCKRLLCVITCAGFSIKVESDIQLARIFCTEVARWPQQRRSMSLRELKLMDTLSTCRQLLQVTRMCKLQSALSLIKWKWEVNSNNAKHVYANVVDTWHMKLIRNRMIKKISRVFLLMQLAIDLSRFRARRQTRGECNDPQQFPLVQCLRAACESCLLGNTPLHRLSRCTGWSWVKNHRWALLLLRHNFAPLCVHRPYSLAIPFYDFTAGWKRNEFGSRPASVLHVCRLSSTRCNHRHEKKLNKKRNSVDTADDNNFRDCISLPQTSLSDAARLEREKLKFKILMIHSVVATTSCISIVH